MNSYEYLNKSRQQIEGVDDFKEWTLLKVSRLEQLISLIVFDLFNSKHALFLKRLHWM